MEEEKNNYMIVFNTESETWTKYDLDEYVVISRKELEELKNNL